MFDLKRPYACDAIEILFFASEEHSGTMLPRSLNISTFGSVLFSFEIYLFSGISTAHLFGLILNPHLLQAFSNSDVVSWSFSNTANMSSAYLMPVVMLAFKPKCGSKLFTSRIM